MEIEETLSIKNSRIENSEAYRMKPIEKHTQSNTQNTKYKTVIEIKRKTEQKKRHTYLKKAPRGGSP